MYLAGCYRREENNPFYSFVILTRAATAIFQDIHERMPVIIPESRLQDWLHQSSNAVEEAVRDLLFERA